MGDITRGTPDHTCLFQKASEQHGYFLAAQARACGFNWDLLSHHTRTGRFIRLRRGLYRLRDYPSSPRSEVVEAWLAVGKDAAVVSHESALELLGLSDAIPDAVHISVPRSRRHLPRLPGAAIHTTTRPPRPGEVAVRQGVRVTAPARTIVDATETGTAPEQIEMAVAQAIERGMVTPGQLREAAAARSNRVRQLVDQALARVGQ